MTLRIFLLSAICTLSLHAVLAQESSTPKDSLSKFDRFNKKAEAFFKVAPVPLIAYSTDAGNIFGLAKFNAFHLSKKDTISRPSKISEVVTLSTKGRVNVSVSNDLVFNEDNYIIMSFFNYRKQPEYLLGIGNDVSRDDIEEVTVDRTKFATVALRKVKGYLYAGVSLEFSDYFSVQTDSNSFLIEDNVAGLNGGTNIGTGLAIALDSRDNRYNASKGELIMASFIGYPTEIGSRYPFTRFDFDFRKYFRLGKNSIIAFQGTTTYTTGTVPFYDLAQLGGEDKMRGYYKGALRDLVLLDTQVEYRLHIWKIFGLVTWVGTGRVADSYQNLDLDGFRLSFGGGVRIQVDSENNINLRIDFGFGPQSVRGTYLNFSEAF